MRVCSSIIVVLLKIWLVSAAVIANAGQKEEEAHGGRSPHERFNEEHHKGGMHNMEKDHEAILGSKKTAEEFDNMSPEESRLKLRGLAKKMDLNGDGLVQRQELVEWIAKSMAQLDDEEAAERFDEMDESRDNAVSWSEYLKDAFGDEDEEDGEPFNEADLDETDQRLVEEDKYYFAAADADGDGLLNREEFAAFQVPENHAHMHQALVDQALKDKDKDGNGRLSFSEFIDDQGPITITGESFKQPDAEWYQSEKTRFESEYDSNKDGELDNADMLRWLVPDLQATAADEADHLMKETDKDADSQLTYDEIVAQHRLWVGSEATNYGEHLELYKDEL